MCTLFGMLLYISSPGQVLPRLYCNLYDLFLPRGRLLGTLITALKYAFHMDDTFPMRFISGGWEDQSSLNMVRCIPCTPTLPPL